MLKNAYSGLYCKNNCELLQRRELTRLNYCDKYQKNLSIDSQGNPYCLPECEFRYEKENNLISKYNIDTEYHEIKEEPKVIKVFNEINRKLVQESAENRIF